MCRFDPKLPPEDVQRHELDSSHSIFTGRLPADLIAAGDEFEQLWNEHPGEHTKIFIAGRWTPIPRFQQAYEVPYDFSGQRSPAIPAPPSIKRYLDWMREHLDKRLNGLLGNWYDGAEHHIGPHHDEHKNLIPNTPIVTLSFGEPRVSRLSQGKGTECRTYDLTTKPGLIIVIPWDTNLSWKHSVPKSKRYRGRRISITARAFKRDN